MSAALWLVSTMFSLAAIYVLLDAQFIAAIQVLVYAGAVMVLFLFVIMLLNLGTPSSDMRGPSSVAAAVVIVGPAGDRADRALALHAAAAGQRARPVRRPSPIRRPCSRRARSPSRRPRRGAWSGPSRRRCSRSYLVPFEITSILLLAAIVGAVVLAKRKV